MDIDPLQLVFLLGLVIVIVTLLRQLGQRVRHNTEKQRRREAALKAAREAERKSLLQTNLPKSKVSLPQTRAPLGDPLGTPFAGNIRGQAARWEAEIHQLGRQIIGQIDSKMAALQAITLDANRTANRLEILVEHLEQIARKQIGRQQEAAQNMVAESVETPSTVISAEESAPAATPLADVLQELTDGIEDFRNTVRQSTTFKEQPEPATILRMEEIQAKNIRREVEMLTNYGLEPPEIAQRLNISSGEVDLILQVQQNRNNEPEV